MDWIKMNQMRFFSHVGCLPEEKENGQYFDISIEMGYASEIKGCYTDNLEDTMDYAVVFDKVKEYVEASSCNLIEYLAQNIVDIVFDTDKRVSRVVVKVEKPHAPIEGCFRSMDVEITRDRK